VRHLKLGDDADEFLLADLAVCIAVALREEVDKLLLFCHVSL
jgi:hypothetical protein